MFFVLLSFHTCTFKILEDRRRKRTTNIIFIAPISDILLNILHNIRWSFSFLLNQYLYATSPWTELLSTSILNTEICYSTAYVKYKIINNLQFCFLKETATYQNHKLYTDKKGKYRNINYKIIEGLRLQGTWQTIYFQSPAIERIAICKIRLPRALFILAFMSPGIEHPHLSG